MPEIQLTQGVVRYRDQGAGAPILLIHGLLVNGNVWDRLVPLLAAHGRCIVPDLPLGSHSVPMNKGADLSAPGLARLIAEFIERLELEDVMVVGNDTGGALCQLVVAHHPERIGRLVLTTCDAFENFPPPAVRPLLTALKLPGALAATSVLGRLRAVRGAAFKAMPLTMQPIADEQVKSWVAPLADKRIRADLATVVRGIDPADTVAAGERLRDFDGPALIAWGAEDRIFPFSDAEHLAAILPNARLERIPNARAFVQLDAPERLAELIGSVTNGAVTTPA
ncbi:MAG TPA: alpha/beta hydrolase [Solirubrobacteraceae bacterium]|nr:alpha/beta hydrolase [Solirubrobacteraceae bacterium]